MTRLRNRCLGISPKETTFAYRGFYDSNPRVRQRLEGIGRTFAQGYHEALSNIDSWSLAKKLNEIDLELRGYAFEGAAMGLSMLDHLTPWRRNRLRSFLAGPGADHLYMIHVGVGWAIARLPWLRLRVIPALAPLSPLLRWLAIDGYGFHEGYFHWRRYAQGKSIPKRLSSYACRVFDQGLGRSLWFVQCADVRRISATIAAFPHSRRADLWSGIGLACAYAGGLDGAAIQDLKKAAGPYCPQLAQGAAFAAKTRQRAGNTARHTDMACHIICEVSAEEAARVTDVALDHLAGDDEIPSYEIWRRRIQSRFAAQGTLI
jgi:hypothetical protein